MQPCILITDDDPLVRDVLARLIRQLGYKVIESSSGAETLRLLSDPSSAQIDLLFTDILMPRMSGIELLQVVHGTRPDLPVAMITGAATLDNSVAALNAGAYAYLIKPVRGEQVREVVEKGLRAREQQRAQSALEAEFMERYKALEAQLTLLQNNQYNLIGGSNGDPLADLIRGLRHELGNATTAIKLNLSVLEEEGGNPAKLREHLKDLEASTDELVSLVTRLKQYPKQHSAHELVDLRQALISLAETSIDKMDRHHIQLDLDVPDEEIYVYGADLELIRVCNNILENAIEATASAGGNRVQIAAVLDANNVTVTVSDEGPGFAHEMIEELFSPGYTTKITEGMVRGLGLGLFIARATINLYGGQIWLENRDQGGALVHIRLPLALADKPPAPSSVVA